VVQRARLRAVIDDRSTEHAHTDAVVRAAWTLFLKQGYAETTLAEISSVAGVREDRIKAEFGTKRQILVEVRRAWLDDAGYESQVSEMLSEQDAARRFTLLARMTRQLYEAGLELTTVMEEAAHADPSVDQMWAALMLVTDDTILANVQGIKDQLASWVTVRSAADIIWALCRAPMYRELVGRRRWTPDQYELWLADSMRQQLLHDTEARPAAAFPASGERPSTG